jgi:uncharacterized protein (TIGR02646 family)
MRKVDRTTVTAPTSLTSATGAGANERPLALTYFSAPPLADGEKPRKKFKFAAYKGDDVVDALKELFHEKCAYCESEFIATGPADIEHYRPKGGVQEDPTHVGYWWLASEWTNLLYSCIDCNRRRRHKLFVPGMALKAINAIKNKSIGKKNSFAINKVRAVKLGDCLNAEDALLIDPTRRDPTQHLQWLFDFSVTPDQCPALVLPTNNNNTADMYGAETIVALALNRQGLVQQRTKHLLNLRVMLRYIQDDIEAAMSETGANRSRSIQRAIGKLSDLEGKSAATECYSEMTKAWFEEAARWLEDHYQRRLEEIFVEEQP